MLPLEKNDHPELDISDDIKLWSTTSSPSVFTDSGWLDALSTSDIWGLGCSTSPIRVDDKGRLSWTTFTVGGCGGGVGAGGTVSVLEPGSILAITVGSPMLQKLVSRVVFCTNSRLSVTACNRVTVSTVRPGESILGGVRGSMIRGRYHARST